MQNVHGWVTQVTFKDGQILLTVLIDEFLPDESVEISGYATQNSGGFANFYDIQPVTENPDGSVIMYVKATPSQPFKEGDDITVVLRAARVWVTVLKAQQDGQAPQPYHYPATPAGPAAPEGAIWNGVRSVGSVSAGGLSTWPSSKTSAGGDSSFPDK